ncbi:hypothetical protein ESN35_03265 [Bifidobacterium pullorum subsp. gallinarum]|uniref:Uncharacterized protein n=1 Tax=Bifidobacterium pullorum subsp. gallinarum TaxID=78344 RepID=A0A4P6DSY6_9BIFI|nr:hypothetical protein [Bifidobacterium pullorum]QAY32555.1 hypothetical protein ESN35_03265 [Bifidobacterium pullorum subsp. gallinarum]
MILTQPDCELWTCDYLRAHIRDVPDLQVDNRTPDDYDGSCPLIVVNDIPGPLIHNIGWDWTLGVTVRGWTKQNSKPCKDLARRVHALLTADPDIALTDGSPFCVPSSSSGPTPVGGDPLTCRYYMTIDYVVRGTIESND